LLKIYHKSVYNFGDGGNNPNRKLYQATYREVGVITWYTFWRGAPSQIWHGEKRQKFGAIFDNFRL